MINNARLILCIATLVMINFHLIAPAQPGPVLSNDTVLANFTDPVSGDKVTMTVKDMKRANTLVPLAQNATVETSAGLKAIVDEFARRRMSYTFAQNDEKFDFKQFEKQIEQNQIKRYSTMQMRQILQQELNAITKRASAEDIQKYYEENREAYNISFSFTMQNIYLMTYDEYTVEDGDTLQAIAKGISGDESKAELIRNKENPSETLLPQKVPSTKDEALLKGKEIKAGDVLLVPMSEEKSKEVYERMVEIKKEIEAEGADFTELAEKYSEASSKGQTIGPLPQGEKKMLREIYDTAVALEEGGISKILRTKHGYQIIKIVKKTDAHTKPLAEVSNDIQKSMKTKFDQEAFEEMWKRITSIDDVKFKEANLKKEGAKDSDVILTIDDFKYTWADLRKEDLKKGVPADISQRKEMILANRNVRSSAMDKYIENQGYLDRPDMKDKILDARIFLMGTQYEQWKLANGFELPKGEIEAYYKQVANKRFKVPANLDVVEIIKKLNPSLTPKQKDKILDGLTKVKKKIKSAEVMQELSVKESEIPALKKLKGLRKGVNENYRGRDFAKTLKKLELNKVEGPFEAGNEAILIMVVAKNQARIKSYDEVKDQVRQEYVKTQQNNLMPKLRAKIIEDCKVEYVYSKK